MARRGGGAASPYYCGVLVLPHYDCARMAAGSAHYGHFKFNEAYYRGSGTVGVCENTYVGGGSLSRRCSNNVATSCSDLNALYNRGYNFDGHAGNNIAYTHTINGYVSAGSGACL